MKKNYSDIEKILYDSAKKTVDGTEYKNVVYTEKVKLKEKKERDTTVAHSILQVAGVFLAAIVIGGFAFATMYVKDFMPPFQKTGTDTQDVTVTETKEAEKQPEKTNYEYKFEGLHAIEFSQDEFVSTKEKLPIEGDYVNVRKLQNKAADDFLFNVYIYDKEVRVTNYNKVKKTWLCLTDKNGGLVAEIEPETLYAYYGSLIYAESSPDGAPAVLLSVRYENYAKIAVLLHDCKTNKTKRIYDINASALEFKGNEVFSNGITLKANAEEGKIRLLLSARRYTNGIVNFAVEAADEISGQDPDITREWFKEYFTKDGGLNDRVYRVKTLVKGDDGYGFVDIDSEPLPSGTTKMLYKAPEFSAGRKFIAVTSGGETYYPDPLGRRTGLCDDGSLQEDVYGTGLNYLRIDYNDDFDIENNVYGKDYRIINIKVYKTTEIADRSPAYWVPEPKESSYREYGTVEELKANLKAADDDVYVVSFIVSWDDGVLKAPGDVTYRFTYYMYVSKK